MSNIKNLSEMIENQELIATKIFEYDLSNKPKIANIKDKYIQDVLFTLRFLAVSLDVEEPLIFVNYMTWFGKLAYFLNFNLISMKNHFSACNQIFTQMLDYDFFSKLNNTYLQGTRAFEISFLNTVPYQIEIDEFLDYLINMDIDRAYQYVNSRIDEGIPITDLYINLFQPTLYRVGELWQQRVITVAKEHYITAAIQHIIGKLYPLLFKNRKSGINTITAVCAGNEMHEIGMRMIVDFFEISGWDSYFLGSNIPIDNVVEHLNNHPTNILAISATTSAHLIDVKKLVKAVKNNLSTSHIKIIVGGKVFNETPNLWKLIDADGYAFDPEQAILLANLMVGESNVKVN